MPDRKPKQSPDSTRSIKKPLGILVGAGLLIWLAFFDSHSLMSRVKWYSEYKSLESQNDQLRSDITFLEGELSKGLSNEAVEKIAREQYGMKRESETVYPVISAHDQ